jgi:hypothetical protein
MTLEQRILGRLSSNLADFEAAFDQFQKAFPLSKAWIQHEWPMSSHKASGALLLGAKTALLEGGTAWGAGLNRAAVTSLRVYIENLFAWLYYKDRPIEFDVVYNKKMDMLLPKDVQKYLKLMDQSYDIAYGEITKSGMRSREYYYTEVSQFIHAHPAAPGSQKPLDEIAVASPREAVFLTICAMADEFISDNYFAFYRRNWDHIPLEIRENLSTRMGRKIAKILALE